MTNGHSAMGVENFCCTGNTKICYKAVELGMQLSSVLLWDLGSKNRAWDGSPRSKSLGLASNSVSSLLSGLAIGYKIMFGIRLS